MGQSESRFGEFKLGTASETRRIPDNDPDIIDNDILGIILYHNNNDCIDLL